MIDNPNAVINFLINEKGGVGKSPNAINLAAFLASEGRPFKIVDADIRATSMHVTFPQAIIVEVSEVDVVDGVTPLGEIIQLAREGRQTIVVDTGANVGNILSTFFEMVDFPGIIQRGKIRVNMLIPIDHSRESRIFAAKIQKKWTWATCWHLHMRSDQDYDRATFPDHPADRVIVFPFIPKKLRNHMQTEAMTIDQAIARKVFNNPLAHDILTAARNRLYTQYREHDRELFYQSV